MSVSFTHSLPVDSHGTSNGTYAIEGRPTLSPADAAKYNSGWRVVGANYFSTLGISLRAGRELDARDTANAPLAVVINESMARAGWPDESPLGHRISIGLDALDQWLTIVGVVADTKAGSLDAPIRQELYVPAAQHAKVATDMKIVARTAIEPLALSGTFRRIARQLDPSVPVRFTTAELLVAGTAATPRFRSLLIGIFAAVALVLAAIGLYSVLAYGVAQRTTEIGIRMALGAQRIQVFALILRGGFKLVAIGIAIGVAVAITSTRLLESMLFGVRPLDPAAYGGVGVLFLAIAALACWLPARKATKVDPLVALRAE